MDITKLIRDKNKVHDVLKEVENNEKGFDLITTKQLKLYIPEWYLGTPLASIDDEHKRIVAIFCLVVDDKYYTVSKACSSCVIEPSYFNAVDVGSKKYLEFVFEPGDTVIKNLNLIRTGTFVYRIYNEFIAKGNIPWYFNNEDTCSIFETALYHGNVNLKVDSVIFEIFASAIARQDEDVSKYYRHDLSLQEQEVLYKPVYIPLNNAAYQATNTTARLIGNYFNEGVTSALVNQSQRNEVIEDLLRGSFDVKSDTSNG